MSLDEQWLPTLLEIEYLKRHGTPEEQVYYSQFGWDQLEISIDCPLLSDRREILAERFMGRYGNRMLNAETMERWQMRLQNRMDEIQTRFERAYKLYDQYKFEMERDFIEAETTTTHGTNQASGSDSSTNNSTTKNIDTPDSAINADDDYADNVSKSSGGGSTTYGRTDTVDNTIVREIRGRGVVDGINDNIDKFRDIDTELIRAFENNFLNIFWY